MTAKFTQTLCAAITTAWAGAAHAAECPRKDALGTSRVLRVDAATSPRVGLKSFPQTLPLQDREVVLTFDDGPWPGTTPRVLAALAHECVRATFFLIGKSAAQHPELVRRIAAQGHTIGHHTWSHPHIKTLKPDAAVADIDKGFAAVEKALHGTATTTPGLAIATPEIAIATPEIAIATPGIARATPSTPFFRYPYFEMTPATLDLLQNRGITVFGADLWASDWEPMKPEQQLKVLTERLQAARKGIILLHDPKAQTAAMMPAFLRYLKDNHYRVVHLVPATGATTAASTLKPK
ncbi:polysaccharide deacetylase family protein [Bradyrhizobium sp. LjRoot220]|uniref:polysaccharide deacetylase family protein n=1 Tax=Bradyrhizobium sp. LjRoot220 TaxID=3342284 RepID=UPI003ECE7F36